MRPNELLASSLLLFTLTSAWPSGWEGFDPNVAALVQRQGLAERQDGSTRTSYNLDFTGIQGDTATLTQSQSDSEATQTGDSDAKTTGTGDSTETGTNTGKSTGKGTQTSAQTSKTYDARLPAGGVSMITPNPMTTQYYKIKDHVTFAWNYTSLLQKPAYVDVLATCTLNQATYTLAMNMSFQETQTLVWDTGKYQATGTVPLLTETYTLIIHDAGKDVSAIPAAGYLGTYNQFTFGMYSPQPYTPMSDYVCATCNSAMSLMERQTLWGLFAMVGLTVMSFGWFTGVAGLW